MSNVTRMRSTYLDRYKHVQHSSPYQRYLNVQHSPPCLSLNSRSYSLYALACDNRTVWIARYCPCPGERILGATPTATLYSIAIILGSLLVIHHLTCTWSRETWSYVLWNWKLMCCRYLIRCSNPFLRDSSSSWCCCWRFKIFVEATFCRSANTSVRFEGSWTLQREEKRSTKFGYAEYYPISLVINR